MPVRARGFRPRCIASWVGASEFGVRGAGSGSEFRVRAVRQVQSSNSSSQLPAPGAMHQDGLVANGRAQATTARPRQGDVLIVL